MISTSAGAILVPPGKANYYLLSLPPRKKALASRMSPAGIPMFYGALDEYRRLLRLSGGSSKEGKS
jgi:hypothetical protein